MIYKSKDIKTNINVNSVEIGDIKANFYTEDVGTASIRIFLNWNNSPINLKKVNLTPKLDLFLADGSIFKDEPLETIVQEKGLLQYNVRDKVIKHSGLVNAKLFLASDEKKIHVANFSFNILDSGVEGKVQKEVNVNLVEDSVRKIVKENAMDLLDDNFKVEVKSSLQSYVNSNPEVFKGPRGNDGSKGPKGDKGEQGLMGPQGPQGVKGLTGEKGDDGKNSTQRNYRDLKIHLDLPMKFNDYDELTRVNEIAYYSPQGLAVDDKFIFILYDSVEIKNRVIVVYNWQGQYITKYYVGNHGGENIHVEYEDDKRYLYAKKDVYTLGKYDITNIEPTTETIELSPVKEFNISLYTNFFRMKEGWGIEARNMTSSGILRRDTLTFYNSDFSSMVNSLNVSPANSILFSNQSDALMKKGSKKQGMTLIDNNIFQTVGGNWNPVRDKVTNVYHLQGVQQLGPSGDIISDYSYMPQDVFNYLIELGKNPVMIEHESAFNYKNKLFCIIVYKKMETPNAENSGILLVEYGATDKEHTFENIGKPFIAPTAKYNPYKVNIDNYLYNEFTGERLTDIKQLTKYMVDSYQNKIVFYTSNVKINDFNNNPLPNGIKVTIENMNNFTLFLYYEDVNNTKQKFIINYQTLENCSIKPMNQHVRYDGIDLLQITDSFEGYLTNTKNIPSGVSASGWLKSKISLTVKRIEYAPYNSADIYVNIAYQDTWQGWKKVTATTI